MSISDSRVCNQQKVKQIRVCSLIWQYIQSYDQLLLGIQTAQALASHTRQSLISKMETLNIYALENPDLQGQANCDANIHLCVLENSPLLKWDPFMYKIHSVFL